MVASRFTSLAEVHARPAFDSRFTVTLDNYRGVVGPTHFPDNDKGSCQLHRNGRLCVVKFQVGFLVRAANDGDEVEALVGKDCSRKYFPESDRFHADAARAQRAVDLQDLHTRRLAVLADPSYQRQLRESQFKLKRYVDDFAALNMPDRIRASLETMGRNGRGAIRVRVAYEEIDEKGKKRVTWESFDADEIVGVSLWNRPSSSIYRDIQAVATAFEGAAAAENESLHELQQRMRRIERLPDLARQIDELHARLRAFTAYDNLARVALLSSSHLDQTIALEFALQRASKPNGRQEVQALLDELMDALRRRYGGRQVVIDA